MYACDPAKPVSIHNRTIWSVLVAIWAVAKLPSALPEWFFSNHLWHHEVWKCALWTCSGLWRESSHQRLVSFTRCWHFCLPLLSAGFYFWRAYGQCQKRGTKLKILETMRSKQLTVMLLSIAITVILWLPEWIAWLWMWHLKAEARPPQGFIALSQVLMFSISSVNSLAFLVCSEEFKEGLKGIWKWMITKNIHLLQSLRRHQLIIPRSFVTVFHLWNPHHSCQRKQKTGSPSFSKEKAEKAEIPILPDAHSFGMTETQSLVYRTMILSLGTRRSRDRRL